MTNDREIYHAARQEALAGAGGMISVRTIFIMLDTLEQRFGDSFTIDGACQALDQLVRMAALAKEELRSSQQVAE